MSQRRSASRVAQAPVNSASKAGNGNGNGGNGASKNGNGSAAANRMIRLDFREVDIDNVLKIFSMAAGKTVIKDPGLTGPVTILLPQPVTLEEGLKVLEAVLNTRGYTLQQEPMLLRVVSQGGRGFGRGGFGRRGEFGSGGDFGGLEELGGFGGRDRGPQITVFKLESANAQQVARIINDLFRGTTGAGGGRGRGGFGGGRFGGGSGIPGVFGGPARGGGAEGAGGLRGAAEGGRDLRSELAQQFGGGGQTVRASADDYTNSVAVLAPSSQISQIRTLIEQLDRRVDPHVITRVFRLENGFAEELAPLVTSLLQGNSSGTAPGGFGGRGGNLPFEQRVRFAMRAGSQSSSQGQVVADARTNSLVVSATEETMATVERIIKELDTPVKPAATTFVMRLENARASDVAQLMNQAFNYYGRGFGFGQGGFGMYGNQNRGYGNQGNRNRNLGGNRGALGGNRGGLGGNRGGNAFDRSSNDSEDEQVRLASVQTPPDEELLDPSELGRQFESAQLPQSRTGVRVTSPLQRGGAGTFGLGASPYVNAVPDTNSNSIIVNTDPETIEMIQQLIRSLDVVSEQVLIEALIVEASLDRSTKLGIDWTLMHNIDGAKGEAKQTTGLDNVTQGLRYSIVGGEFQGVLKALATDQRFNILATPRIFTSNNQPAEINIGQQVPYIISVREADTGTQTFNYGYMDVGIILNVVPRIAKNGLVTMDVEQTANELTGFTSFNAPIIAQRQTSTQVSVADGQTVIIGGIIRDTETKTANKIPILGDLPLVGGLFRSTDKTKSKTELMVFLTPRIVRSPQDAATLTEEQKKQLRSPVPPSPGPLPQPKEPTPSGGDRQRGRAEEEGEVFVPGG